MTIMIKPRVSGALKAVILSTALVAGGVAHAQITLTPVEQSGEVTEASASKVKPKKTAKAKPCKKGGGLGGLLSLAKKTGLTGTLVNNAVGGGMSGYAAGQVANVAVEEGAAAEQKAASEPAKC